GPAAVEFAVEDNVASNNPVLMQQFELADSDQNGYVDRTESMHTPLAILQAVFALADRDGDGKLFKKELQAYNEWQSDALGSRLMLTIADRGRVFFERLDADSDQKLSVRELRRARE